MQSTITQQSSRLLTLQAERDDTKINLDRMHTRCNALKRQVDDAEALRDESQQISRQLRELNGRLANVNLLSLGKDNTITTLNSRNATLEDELAESQSAVVSTNNQNQELHHLLAERNRLDIELQLQHSHLRGKYSALQVELQAVQSVVTTPRVHKKPRPPPEAGSASQMLSFDGSPTQPGPGVGRADAVNQSYAINQQEVVVRPKPVDQPDVRD